MKHGIWYLVSAAAAALAQTPSGGYPSTRSNLGARFGNETITPGVWISPDDVGSQPVVYTREKQATKHDSTYMIFMLDLNIPDSDVTTSAYYSTLVPGLAINTTTRLHWWGGNYTIGKHGLFVNSSDAIAEYTAPRPRDSTNHTYILYLFEQLRGYVLPEEALDGTYYSQTAEARFNFTLAPIVKEVGEPVAATYFLSNNP